jgi:hypothetical protein
VEGVGIVEREIKREIKAASGRELGVDVARGE